MAFLHALTDRNIPVVSAFNRTEVNSAIKEKFPDCFFGRGFPEEGDLVGDLIILAVSDDSIAEVAKTIAAVLSTNEGINIIHCSGTHSSEILEPLKKKGIRIASFHPIKAITKNTVSFEGIWFDMEGDKGLLIELNKLADRLGAFSFEVKPKAKPFLHASAVVASNYLVVLAELVSKISAQGNIPERTAIKALAPLMENTLSNINGLGVTDALTGPIARGDVQTIEKHLNSLEPTPELYRLYKTLGLEAVEIAERKNGVSSSLSKIKKLLS